MRIAIIGVSNIGSALVGAFRTAGHTVVVSSRHASHAEKHAEKIAEELDVSAASSNRAAAENAEMVVLAVPAKAVASVLDETAEFLDTIVVDSTNPADEDAETILRASASLAEAVVLLAPGARVVKAFNTVFVSRLNDPVIDGIPLDGFYAGDDVPAKHVVADLLADMGSGRSIPVSC